MLIVSMFLKTIQDIIFTYKYHRGRLVTIHSKPLCQRLFLYINTSNMKCTNKIYDLKLRV